MTPARSVLITGASSGISLALREEVRSSWLALTPVEVAAAGHLGFTAGRAVVVPGLLNRLFLVGTRLLPTGWLARYVGFAASRPRREPADSQAQEKTI